MIYVIQVQPSKELRVRAELIRKSILSYVPIRELLIHKSGLWTKTRDIIFPSYVFVEIDYSAELHHLIKQTDGVLKILGAPSPLPEYESEIMRWLFNDGEIIEQSNALIDDFGNCIGYEGFLSGQDDKITYLNKRQCKASVAVKFGGRVHKANLGIELKTAPKADDNTGQG